MTCYTRWLLCVMVLSVAGAVVLPRPPSSQPLRARATSEPEHGRPGLLVVTSSELPKQIPAPPPPPDHSSTPQYQEEDQLPGLAQFKLLWVTKYGLGNSAHTSTTLPLRAPNLVIDRRRHYAHRTDLLPNMV